MEHHFTKYLRTKSRNFLRYDTKTIRIPSYYNICKCLFHSSPHLLKGRNGKRTIEIDAFKEELFPTRKGNVLYEEELALSDKIRSVRIAKKRKMHQIETQKHANLIFEILQEALTNGKLKKANVTWEYLEYAPKFINDGSDAINHSELDNYVQIDLVDVGFEIIGVTMANHRQYCVIWWKYNNLCKLNGGTKLIDKVLDLYANTLRAIISRKMALKMTPRLIFRKAEDTSNENSSFHKQKMEHLVENALIEQYQKYLGIEFTREDNENDIKYKNEQYHDLLMNKIYSDWRYDKHGNILQPVFNLNTEKRNINDKWIQTFLTKVNGNKPTKIERDMIKKKRKEKQSEKHREKANLLNRILRTDPDFVANNYNKSNYSNDILISSKQQQTNVAMKDIIIRSKPRIKKRGTESESESVEIVLDNNDIDLVGFVE